MKGSGRCWWDCRAQQQVILILLVGLSVLALLSSAGQIILERDSMLYEGDMCELRNGSTGICRPANQCDWVLGQPWAVQELVTCSFNKSTPIICCPVQVEPRLTTTVAKRTSILQCEKHNVSQYLADHIFGGVSAQFGEFPYMAALGYGMPNGSDANSPTLFRCGASLISPSYLLTAAHCLLDIPVFARLGVLELQPEKVVDPPLDIAIKKVILHPNYTSIPLRHDIALLELEEPIDGEWPFVEPVCLYPNATNREGLDSQYPLSVQGWGKTDPYESDITRLMKANVTIIEYKECNSSIPRSRRLPASLFPEQLCALGRNEKNETTGDTCTGDSGGPLELNVDGRHYLVGITSQGTVCGSGIPGIYTEVALYLDWIESIVWSDS